MGKGRVSFTQYIQRHYLVLIELLAFTYLYVYNKIPNGCKDPVENRQI